MAATGTFGEMLSENRRTLALAAPIVAGFVGQMLMGITDTVMVGHVGVVPLAACGFANTVLAVPLVFGFGILAAVSVASAQAFGSGQPKKAGEALRAGIAISLAMGLLMALSAHALLPHLGVFGQPDEVNRGAGGYFLLCAWSFIPVFVTGSTKNFCEALGKPWPPFWIMMAGVGLNVFLNWVFIFGNLGAEAMGLEGAGLATLLSRTAVMIVILAYPALSAALRSALPGDWLAPGLVAESRRLLGIGIHTGGLNLSEITGFSFGSLMMGWLGIIPLAAHQIALTCAATTFMVPLGLAQAASVRVGHALGAGRKDRLPFITGGVIGLTAAVMAAFAACYFLLGDTVAGAFTADTAVRDLTVKLFVLAGVFQVFDGVQIVSSGALRGFSDTAVPFGIGVFSYWIVALPVSWTLAFQAGMGAEGIWIGFVVGLFVAALAMLARLVAKVRAAQ